MKFKDGMICPVCENGTLMGIFKDLPWNFGIFPKRHKTVFEDAKIFVCNNCPESFLDEETNERINLWLKGIKEEN